MTKSQVTNQQFSSSNVTPDAAPETVGSVEHQAAVVGTMFLVVFIIVAALGLADSIYLTIEHYMNAIPPCTISNCEIVLTSKYSLIFGVPVSLFGALYYAAVLVLGGLYINGDKKPRYIISAFLLTHIGLAASLYFTYIQAFVISAWCQYCLMSAASSTVLWIMGRVGLRRNL